MEYQRINYYEEPLTHAKLKQLLKKLKMRVADLLRQSEPIFRELKLGDKNMRYLSLIAQHNRKNAEIVNAIQGRAEALLGNESVNIIQAKRSEALMRAEKLQQEANKLQEEITKLSQMN